MGDTPPLPKLGEVYMVTDEKGVVLWPPREWRRHDAIAQWEQPWNKFIEPVGEVYLAAGETIMVIDTDPSGSHTVTGITTRGERVMLTGFDVLLGAVTSLGEEE